MIYLAPPVSAPDHPNAPMLYLMGLMILVWLIGQGRGK